MKFQFFNCALISKWCAPDGQTYEQPEVYFALFGRDVINNEVVAVTFRYCPYVVVTDPATKQIRFTRYQMVEKTAMHGFTEERKAVYRLFVPFRGEFERIKRAYRDNEVDILDPHHSINLELQLRLVLKLKPLDIITLTSPKLATE